MCVRQVPSSDETSVDIQTAVNTQQNAKILLMICTRYHFYDSFPKKLDSKASIG